MPKPSGQRFAIGTTPFPNFLLDRVMPRLTDTEWRLLCVIVRQTYGWRSSDGLRKTSDWMSHFQLKRKTGRESAAISLAIDVLVRAQLIAVRDMDGHPLLTSTDRRRSRHHLCFSLHPGIGSGDFQRHFAVSRFRNSVSMNNKRNPYKRKQQHGLQLEFSTDLSTGASPNKDKA